MKYFLKKLGAKIEAEQPKTLEELVHIMDFKYGFSVHPVYYFGYYQGVRIQIVPRSKSHWLPAKDRVYCISEHETFDPDCSMSILSGCGCKRCS